jgi:voltage-gated potassium channel
MKIDPKKIFSSHLSVSVGLILLLILTGTAGYMFLEHLSALDALYHTVITIATVGFADLPHPKEETRIFTIFLVLSGLASFYYFAGAIAETLIAGRIFEAIKMKRIEEGLEKVRDHVILCGYGDVGMLVAEKMKERSLVAIERSEERLHDLSAKGILYVRGDSTNPEALKQAGIERARAMIIALNSDPEVVYTILTAKELNPHIKIYARANELNSIGKMKKAGANYVICLPEVGSRDLVNALEGTDQCMGHSMHDK